MTDMILRNARITTMDPVRPAAEALAITGAEVTALGTDAEIMALATPATRVLDAKGARVIPGLIDSHTHIIRQGNNFAMELRWDEVPSLADGLRLLREQARRTLPGAWVRVVGGWSADQFAEAGARAGGFPALERDGEARPGRRDAQMRGRGGDARRLRL
jgi:predicted amidohydrolase YtcJ